MEEWQRARELAHSSALSLSAETVGVCAALGRHLARPLTARVDSRGSDRAAMDGYAVAGAAPWRVVGRTLAGDAAAGALTAGQAVEIATGAVPPPGATAVLPYEHSHRTTGILTGETRVGQHIRRRGEEFAEGEELVAAGGVLSPVHLGLASAMGLDSIDVLRLPSVSAVITGAEVVSHGVPHEHQVRDAVGPMLPGMVASAGGSFRDLVRIGDQARLLEDHLAARVDDIVLVTGASSVGPSDFLAHTMTGLGARRIVDSVGCRPGHPQSLWKWEDSFIVGLPGNPLAALAAFVTLALPLLDRMGGRPLRSLERHRAHRDLEAVLQRSTSRRRGAFTVLSPCRLTGGLLTSVGHAGSAMLRGSVNASGFAVAGPGASDGIVFHAFPWSIPTP